MNSLTTVTLIENSGKARKVIALDGGICVAKFTLATAKAYKSSNIPNYSQRSAGCDGVKQFATYRRKPEEEGILPGIKKEN